MKLVALQLVALICLLLTGLKAQDKTIVTDQFIADIFEQYSAETEEEMDFETFYEELMELAESPIVLNSATKEQLEKLPFLSDIQIENILSYKYSFGSFNSLFELQLIDGLDMTDIRRMLPFVVLGESQLKTKKIYMNDLLKYDKNQVLLRFDKGIEPKAGYQSIDSETGSVYLGSSLYNSVKYQYRFKDRIKLGLTMEKDAGEQFAGNTHKGYDFYSFHAQLNDIAGFKTIVVGDFRASFGQGLVLGSAFGMGKSSYVLKINTAASGLKKYSSTNESSYFRGLGATIKFGRLDLTAFYSNKNIDADTVEGNFQSIYKTGLHRTTSEFEKRATVKEQIAGLNTSLTFRNAQVGFTFIHTRFNQSLTPELSTYNHFYFEGNKQSTGGIHYRARWHKFNFFGETAVSEKWSMATINGLSFSPHSQVSLVILQRYFSPEYDTFYANTFSESSRVNNESGIYLGAEIRPYKRWKIAAYADSYRFPWPKFGIDAPSLGQDYLFQLDFMTRKDLIMFWRVKYEEKFENASIGDDAMALIVPLQKASFRYQLSYSYRGFSCRNIIEGNMTQKGNSGYKYGVTALQDVSYSFSNLPLKVDVRYQFFDAVEYDNRFYSYEKDILYAFSIPMYYGKGSRYYLNIKYDLTNSISLWCKYAQTVYADGRESVSSGNEEIKGNRKSDVRFMLRWEF